jgi:hypothetical protein
MDEGLSRSLRQTNGELAPINGLGANNQFHGHERKGERSCYRPFQHINHQWMMPLKVSPPKAQHNVDMLDRGLAKPAIVRCGKR